MVFHCLLRHPIPSPVVGRAVWLKPWGSRDNLSVQEMRSHFFYLHYFFFFCKNFRQSKILNCSPSVPAPPALPGLPQLLVMVSTLAETWLFSPEPRVVGFEKEALGAEKEASCPLSRGRCVAQLPGRPEEGNAISLIPHKN